MSSILKGMRRLVNVLGHSNKQINFPNRQKFLIKTIYISVHEGLRPCREAALK